MTKNSIVKFFTTPAVKLKFGSSPQMTSRPRFLKGGSWFLSEKCVNFFCDFSQLFSSGLVVFIVIIVICGVLKSSHQVISIGGIVLPKHHRAILEENLQGVALTDIAGTADFFGNDHAAEVINAANNASCFHANFSFHSSTPAQEGQ